MSNYNMNEQVQSESKGLDFMDVGIHENCKLVEIKHEISPNGNPFIAFYFENLDGKKLSFTEYQPIKREGQSDIDFNKKIQNQMSRIKHIATKFVTEEEFKFEAKDFIDFAKKVIEKLPEQKYKDKLVRLKVVYNYNNFTTLPNYLPFIEKMEISKSESKLTISSIDKMTRSTGDRESFTQVDPFATNNTKTKEEFDTPDDKESDGEDFPF